MGEHRSQELRAFQELARAAASGPYDPDALVDRICREVTAAFDLARADFVGAAGVAARHPVIEHARRERQAVTDGTRVAAPLYVDDDCLGFLIGDAGDELDPDQLRDLHATAYEQTSRLALLTEQLLDLSRLEAGAVTTRREGVRLRQLVDELLVRTVPHRLADILVGIDPELELGSDPDALERVLSNLIVMASPTGAVPKSVSSSAAARPVSRSASSTA